MSSATSLLNVKSEDFNETSKCHIRHRNGRFTQVIATMNTTAGRRVYSNRKHIGWFCNFATNICYILTFQPLQHENNQAAKRSADVAPDRNLRNPSNQGNKARKWGDQSWLWNLWPMSTAVQHRAISGPTERTNALQNLVEQRTICYYRPQTKFGAR